jgi:hypothetical protein
VTSVKLADANSALFNGRVSGPGVSGGFGTSVVLGSASRILCDGPLPGGAETTTALRLAEQRSKVSSADELGVTYRGSDKGCSREDERAGLYR